MKAATRTKVDTMLRDEWLHTLDTLRHQIEEWVREEPGWSFEQSGIQEVADVQLGAYTTDIWSIITPKGEVRLEPKPLDFLGHRYVEIYAWPTLRRVHLMQSQDGIYWRVRTDSGIFLRQPWNRENFVLLVQDLIEAE